MISLLVPAALGLAVLLAAASHPVTAVLVLLVAMFLRVPTPEIPMLPVDLFVLFFLVAVGSAAMWVSVRMHRLRRLGALEIVMGIYVLWNVYSMVSPHRFSAAAPLSGEEMSVIRFIVIGTVIPFTAFLVARLAFDTERAVRALLWTVVALGAYSALVSILQFRAPALVWPRYILENETWPGRAVGVTNQPIGNGTILMLAFVCALVLAARGTQLRQGRWLLFVVAGACAYGVFLTYTRAVWLAFGIVIVAGMILARGFRTGFVVTATAAAAGIATSWSTFTSSDRRAGGVGSTSEIHDRFNTFSTASWAIREEPWTGWGIGRFTSVNTYFHRTLAPEIPWEGGFAIDAHFTEMGIAAELGLIGLALWLTILVLLIRLLVRAYRTLPAGNVLGQPLAIAALLAVLCMLVTGVTADLRNLDVTNALVMTIAGAAIGCAGRYGTPDRSPELRREEVPA
ncbi:O-antigen ligase family protein [Rhodococcus sp. NPDC058639]|uniref:O-antigen ligase family protein n=1 Tax=Rhodococcus sp. NPDC058639 TaxID=3346570 RepID=UPI003657CA4D